MALDAWGAQSKGLLTPRLRVRTLTSDASHATVVIERGAAMRVGEPDQQDTERPIVIPIVSVVRGKERVPSSSGATRASGPVDLDRKDRDKPVVFLGAPMRFG